MTELSGNELILVLGGARSGKSSWALRYTETHYRSCFFLATAEVLDDEMAERVRLHKLSRGPEWNLVEEPLNIAHVLEQKCAGADAVLIDCLTVWLSNVLLKSGEESVPFFQEGLLRAFAKRKQSVIAVANEVGMGIVPEYPLGRKFRDFAGTLNQEIAAMADKVVFTMAGLPTYLKGSSD